MTNDMKVKTLIPWFGSNRTLAHTVGEALRGCRWVGIPFAGGMSELVHVDAPTIVVNDVHWHVMNFANVCRHPTLGPKLFKALKRTPFHPVVLATAQITLQRADVLRPDGLLDYEMAFHYFVSQWMGRSAKSGTTCELSCALPVRWNANGGDSNTRYRSAVRSLMAWRRILQRCNFTCLDCFEFFDKTQDAEGNGVYCDPPFPDVGDVYKHRFTGDQHRQLAKVLGGYQRTRVICRFYDHPLIRELYPESLWVWKEQVGRKQSNAKACEMLLSKRQDKEGTP